MRKRQAQKNRETASLVRPHLTNSWGGLSPEDYSSVFFGNVAKSGTYVSERSVLTLSTVYACVNLLCGALVSMPLNVYESQSGNNDKAIDHPLWWLFNEAPHPSWTASAFWNYMMLSRLFHGDAYARIIRKSPLSPNVLHFEPVHPANVETKLGDNGVLLYTLRHVKDLKGNNLTVDQADMIHVTNLGFDGIKSMSTLQHALRNVGGAALAVDEYSSTYFKNNATPSIAITLPPGDELSPDALQQFRSQWEQKHAGVANSHVPTILSNGMEVKPISMSAEDAQLIATRNFQVEDICRVFGVPPFMVGHTQNTSSWGTGVEQMGLGFVKYTMQRHLNAIEQEINRKIWPKRSAGFFARFNTAGIERGDIKTRNESYRIALGRAGEPGWMTINEIRKLENLPPIDGGEVLYKPTQGQIG